MSIVKPRFVGIKETARLFGVSDHTVRAWCDSRVIASHKLIGRRMIAIEEVERLIREGERPRIALAGRKLR